MSHRALLRLAGPTLLALHTTLAPAQQPTVAESARSLPTAAEVDVVIVGGSAAGVAAAVAAAKAGARVFLAAPRTYLGEDLCGTLRLWLEDGEAPQDVLSRQLFQGETAAQAGRPSIPFTYRADLPSVPPHRDSAERPLLTDGVWESAGLDSVQYNGDVSLTLDCGSSRDVLAVTLLAYRRDAAFAVGAVSLDISADGKTWQSAADAERPEQPSEQTGALDSFTLAVGRQVRFARLRVKRAPGCPRILLAELLVRTSDQAPAATSIPAVVQPPTPLHVKRVLDRALQDAGVAFVFGSYPSDLLLDADGTPAGVVIANRAGRQAVSAKVIIDATDRATLARMAGAEFAPHPPVAETRFHRVLVGGAPPNSANSRVRTLPFSYSSPTGRHSVHEVELRLPFDGGWASLAQAEQAARDATWHGGCVAAAETLFHAPQEALVARARVSDTWMDASEIPTGVCQPVGLENVYVAGPFAGFSPEQAARVARPLDSIALGTRVGQAAARTALDMAPPQGLHLVATPAAATESGDIAEQLTGLRATPGKGPTISAGRRLLPVAGRYDVVVVGGGTAGAPAAIGAARHGAKTLVIEYLHDLGGVSTAGLIGKYYHGNRVGFTREIDAGVAALGAEVGVLGKSEYYRRTIRQAGAEIWFGAVVVGTWVEGRKVRGVVVATPYGRVAVAAGVVVDATGNSDVAAAAGARTTFVSAEHVAMQGTGLPPIRLGASYTNTDYTFVDDTDMLDLWRLFVTGRKQAGRAFDFGQLVDSRERRRIVGDVVLSPLDILNKRTWPDTICIAKSDFDSHGYTVHPAFLLQPPSRDGKALMCPIPYRVLIPENLEGILVTGLGISAHRDAMPIIRMQPDVQNQGYAAGVAAAMASRYTAGIVRNIDVRGLQRHLVDQKNLPETVLTQKDSYPLAADKVAAAVGNATTGGQAAMAAILAAPDTSLPLLRRAYATAETDAGRLAYAHVLGMMGDATGAETLRTAVSTTAWDGGWNFRGMGQYGASLSSLDSLIVALGRTRDPDAVPVLIEKARSLSVTNAFSHYRALAMALETLGDPAAAQPLATLLSRPGMTGYVLAAPSVPENRNASLRELILARALYRCGDHDGLGKRILQQYEGDLRGVFSRHAHAVLDSTP